jgi:hypothetical protein
MAAAALTRYGGGLVAPCALRFLVGLAVCCVAAARRGAIKTVCTSAWLSSRAKKTLGKIEEGELE